MTLNDRILFHQIHPAKLLTDASAVVLCLYLPWRRDLSLAVLVAMVPPLIASGLVLRFTDLEALKQSTLGVYVKRHMTPAMLLLRVCGFLVMAVAAWNHAPIAILAGLGIVRRMARRCSYQLDAAVALSEANSLSELGLNETPDMDAWGPNGETKCSIRWQSESAKSPQ